MRPRGIIRLPPGISRDDVERVRRLHFTVNEARIAAGLHPVSSGLGDIVAVPGVNCEPFHYPARTSNCRNCGAPPSPALACEYCGTYYG